MLPSVLWAACCCIAFVVQGKQFNNTRIKGTYSSRTDCELTVNQHRGPKTYFLLSHGYYPSTCIVTDYKQTPKVLEKALAC